MTWTLYFDLAPDAVRTGGSGDTCTLHVDLNGISLGDFTSNPESGNDGIRDWKSFTVDVSAIFDPDINNHLVWYYVAGNDGTHTRRTRIVGSDGRTYYGEYPSGSTYGPAVQDGGTWFSDSLGALFTFDFLSSDGTDDADQYLANTGHYGRPLAEGDGRGHLYFTIPTVYKPWTIGSIAI